MASYVLCDLNLNAEQIREYGRLAPKTIGPRPLSPPPPTKKSLNILCLFSVELLSSSDIFDVYDLYYSLRKSKKLASKLKSSKLACFHTWSRLDVKFSVAT